MNRGREKNGCDPLKHFDHDDTRTDGMNWPGPSSTLVVVVSVVCALNGPVKKSCNNGT